MNGKGLNSTGMIEKSINQIEPKSTNVQVDISTFPIGSHFVSVFYPNKTISYKFVKIG